MRIGIISSQVFKCPVVGYAGLEVIAYETARGLAKRGHQVLFFAPDGSKCEGCEVIPTGPAGQFTEQQAYDKYWKVLPSLEVVIDHSWQKYSYLLKAEGRLQAPVLGVLHAPVNTMLQSPPPVPKPCIVCISENQKNHYEALFNADARVCYNGIDTGYYKPMTVKRTDRFLFLARFSRIKGADIAIKACLEAGVGLDLVGDTSITNEPDYLQECFALAKQKSPSWDESLKGTQIRVHGGASRGECVRWFSQAYCMLHPNERFKEPFGMAPVEAMLCGCPVIAWDNGAMGETIRGKVNGRNVGWLVTEFPELVKAITDPMHPIDRYTRTDCQEWASRFSIDNMAARYEALCTEAIQKGW